MGENLALSASLGSRLPSRSTISLPSASSALCQLFIQLCYLLRSDYSIPNEKTRVSDVMVNRAHGEEGALKLDRKH